MWIVLGVIGFVLFLLTPVRVAITVQREGEDDRLRIEVWTWFRWMGFRREITRVDWEGWRARYTRCTAAIAGDQTLDVHPQSLTQEDIRRRWRQSRRFLRQFRDVRQALRVFTRHLTCERFSWESRIGTGDAALTGMLTGLAWMAKGAVLATATRYVRLKAVPHIRVIPAFDETTLSSCLTCMLRIRIGQAILAMAKLMWTLYKGREERWRSIPSRV